MSGVVGESFINQKSTSLGCIAVYICDCMHTKAQEGPIAMAGGPDAILVCLARKNAMQEEIEKLNSCVQLYTRRCFK